jgi:outer membrane protein
MTRSQRPPLVRLIGLLAALLAAPGARGETLQEALALAYRTNPTLQSQRFQQAGLDETYVQAKAGWRLTANASGQAEYEREPNSLLAFNQGSSGFNFGYGAVTVAQPLYTGGRTIWAAHAALAAVNAGRQGLRSVEAQVLLAVVQGYLDVLRDQQILAIRQADLATLERQAAESSAKFTLGQVTKTDVSQARAQLEETRASLAAAEAQLEISKAEFQAAVGEAPSTLEAPVSLPGLPTSLDQAFALAEASNPVLLQSREQERASRARVAEAKAGSRPTVSLQGSFGYIGPLSPLETRDYAEDIAAGVTVNLPLLTGGVVGSQIRQASAQNSSDRAQIEAARRQVIQATSQAWSLLLAGRAEVRASEAQAEAAATALAGAQAEYGFGLRTTLDVLISDTNLRAAQLSLAESRHDAFLAEAAVLEASGRLELKALIPGAATYDPARNFDKVKDAGAPPWEGLVRAVDQIGAPTPGAGPP